MLYLRFGKAELPPDELSRLSKAQKREMYAAHAARSAVHREVDQYEDENVGVQALSEGEKAAGNVRDISKSRYARKLKKKAKMQGKKGSKTAKSSASEPTASQDAGASGTGEGGSNWLSRWRQKQNIRQSYYAAARSGTAAQTAGGKAASNGASAARSGVEQAVERGKTAVSTAVKGLANAAKSNAHVLVIVGVFLLLILMVMSGFSSCGILFGSGTQVSGQTMYSAEDRDIRGAEQDYKKLEKELDKKIKRTPTDHPGYNEYQYHLDPIEHDPWQLTSFLTTLYDDYTRSEVQGKLKETFKKQYKLTTWVEVQTRYMTVWVMTPAGIPVPTQVPYEYRIFHTKLVNKGLEVVIREELDNDQWKRYEIFQDTLGGRPYLFNGGLPPGGSDGSGAPGIDYQVPAEALTDSEFAAIYKEAQKYVGTPYVWGGSTPETGFDCSGYVCWVYNQNGYDVGRTTANGLWNKSQHISEAEAKPGDLVFFEGTYDTPGKSHVGIDRNAKGQQTVHFMNLVDEADLLTLMEEDAADAYTAEKEAAAQAEQERKQAEEDALMKNKIIGICPNCGANVVEREKGWFCENRECRFVLWKDNAFLKRLGKRMDAHVADKLLRDGRVRLKDCKSAKGKTYNATVLLSCEADGRSKFSLEFENGGC